MIVKVHMLAYTDGDIREVTLRDRKLFHVGPDAEQGKIDYMLNLAFFYGQNENQPQELPSVSVGDVIEFEGRFHRVQPFGFRELTAEELDAYRLLPTGDRVIKTYGWVSDHE